MARIWNDDAVRGLPPAPPSTPEGTRGPRLPEDWCRLCWHDQVVWQDGVWMLDHIGSLDDCLHACHDQETLLGSVS